MAGCFGTRLSWATATKYGLVLVIDVIISKMDNFSRRIISIALHEIEMHVAINSEAQSFVKANCPFIVGANMQKWFLLMVEDQFYLVQHKSACITFAQEIRMSTDCTQFCIFIYV